MEFSIQKGPTKAELSKALFQRPARGIDNLVSFISEKRAFMCNVRSIEMEDISHESWQIKGWIKQGCSYGSRFTAYYNTGNKSGILKIMEE